VFERKKSIELNKFRSVNEKVSRNNRANSRACIPTKRPAKTNASWIESLSGNESGREQVQQSQQKQLQVADVLLFEVVAGVACHPRQWQRQQLPRRRMQRLQQLR
jgi:hypothetical protein